MKAFIPSFKYNIFLKYKSKNENFSKLIAL